MVLCERVVCVCEAGRTGRTMDGSARQKNKNPTQRCGEKVVKKASKTQTQGIQGTCEFDSFSRFGTGPAPIRPRRHQAAPVHGILTCKLRGARHGSWQHLILKQLSLGLGFSYQRSNLSTSKRSVLLTSLLTSDCLHDPNVDWLHSLSPPGPGFIALAKGIGFSPSLLCYCVKVLLTKFEDLARMVIPSFMSSFNMTPTSINKESFQKAFTSKCISVHTRIYIYCICIYI